MTNGFVPISTAPGDSHLDDASPDDATVTTPPRGERARSKDTFFQEKTIRFRFPPSEDGRVVPPPLLHIHWMHAVQDAFGDQVQFIDNNNRRVPKIDPLRYGRTEGPTTYFKWYCADSKKPATHSPNPPSPTDRRITRYTLHRIRTTYSIGEIKTSPKVQALLKDHNFFVNEHRWNETEWDTIQLGFFFGLDPTFYDVDQATAKVTAEIQSQLPRQRIPKFKLSFTSPKVQSGRRTYRTKAYAIESDRSSSKELIALLKQAYKANGAFIPYQMRQRHPDAFKKLIQAQTQVLAKNRVIVLNHIGQDAMYYLSDHINAVAGVQAILPAKSIEKDGKFKVSVLEKDYLRIRTHLVQLVPTCYEQYVEPDERPPANRYPGPPQVAPHDMDDYSTDEKSYMTISVNSAMSFGSVLSDDSLPEALGGHADPDRTPTTPSMRTWADLVSDPSQASNMRSTSTPRRSPIDDDLISDLASSRAEVADLRAQVALLQADRIRTDLTIAETVQQQVAHAVSEQMAQIAAQDRITSNQFSTFVASQEHKFEALTNMFSQMMATVTAVTQQVPQHGSTQHVSQPPGPPQAIKRPATSNAEDSLQSDEAEVHEIEDNVRKRIDHRATPPQKPHTLLRQPRSADDTARNLFPIFAAKGPSEGYSSPLSTEQIHTPLESDNMPYSKEVGIPSKSSSGNESKNPSQAPLEENEPPSEHHVEH